MIAQRPKHGLQLAAALWPALLMLASATAAPPPREVRNFDAGWRFHKGEISGAENQSFDDSGWRRLDLPHDWSIEGPYSADLASGTGYLPGGIGWYRKSFRLPETARRRGVSIEFDGVYRDSDVWINGRHLGHRPYGYSSFSYELSGVLRFGEANNVVAVRVDHSVAADSRWYTGSGIYRHVRLVLTNPIHVAHWGTFVTTPVIGEERALVSIETRVRNEHDTARPVRLVTMVVNPNGRVLVNDQIEASLKAKANRTFTQQLRVPRPRRWSVEQPVLYMAISRLYEGEELADEYHTPFGIRTIRFDPDEGFLLNGRPTKIRGVCLHHDLGALGAVVSKPVLESRLRLMKKAGANAIRCSHNPMAPELYELADRLGFLVMDEAFDEWTLGKRKWVKGWNRGAPSLRGYHEVFEQWAVRDLETMLLRDRNHPSIVLWSIGNEIDYPGDPFTHPLSRLRFYPGAPSATRLPRIGRLLASTVKRLDQTRPVTLASADINASNATGLADVLDVVGYNYQEQFYERDHRTYPNRVILGSENGDSIAAWRAVANHAWVAGQFLWTGIDFLGESGRFPHRGSNAGLFDYCGHQKPVGYFREALWSNQPMVYAAAWGPTSSPLQMLTWQSRGRRPLAAHWNWASDSRKKIPVEVYSNCDTVELRLNGKSLGEKRITDRTAPVLFWMVPNEAGELDALGKRDGKTAARFALKTAGPARKIVLRPERTALRADGADMVKVEVTITDSDGVRAPEAGEEIRFEVDGPGRLEAVNNADPFDIAPVQASQRRAWKGRALAIVRTAHRSGRIVLKATAEGLEPAEVAFTAGM